MMTIYILLAFLSGSLPFSVWISRLALQTDIRTVGDGNPGATNVWKTGGAFWGVLAIVLDFAKGVVPVAIVNYWVGLEGWALTTVALAPILGHAFSPFLRFRGGKALAVTFGIWTGLTLWFAPIILGIAFGLWRAIFKKDAWAVLFGLLTLLIACLLFDNNPVYVAVCIGCLLILGWKQRMEIRHHKTIALAIGWTQIA